MGTEITYREFYPHPALRKFIECYWTTRGSLTYGISHHRVLPDGCMDIIFNFGDSWNHSSSSGFFRNSEKSYVVGTMSRPILVEYGNDVDFFGVRFKPGRAYCFLRFSAYEITDQHVSLNDIWGHSAIGLANRLYGMDLFGRIRTLDQEFLQRLPGAEVPDPVLEEAISLIVDQQGTVNIQTLSSAMGVSRQNLTRKFRHQVGIGPKLLSRVVRFRSLLRQIRGGRLDSWSLLAQQFGYFDQSHMISEFLEFTGESPGHYSL